ncbi:hypothetical protein [Parashewanella tropica]|uniref:hypothetical protein n=1 Tax=Parashewanella tropica TaxID=2547970 RepID=UPI001059A185|nr:hypothetical protein [Parashewanella tropica]
MKWILSAALSLLSVSSFATTIPPMSFGTSFNFDEMKEEVQAQPMFAKVDNEHIGAPIRLEVSHTFKGTAGGAAASFASIMWSSMSLGVLPIVTNKDLVIRYELRVNGKRLSYYEFSNNFTEAKNLYSEHNSFKLSGKPLEWVKSTVPEATKKFEADPKVKALLEEYQFYFGDVKKAE